MTLKRSILLLMALATPACTREHDLPPVPRIEGLTFEGTLPEGFSLGGIAVMRATKKTRECFGTIAWLWRHTAGGDAQGYPRRTVMPVFEELEAGRYRLHFRFDEQVVGEPCRWQLEGIQIDAKWGPEADGRMIVYTSKDRSLDTNSELWMGAPMYTTVVFNIPCLTVEVGKVRQVCRDRVPSDRGIPMFEGTLTIPLDVFVPGGLQAARTRLLAERALEPEDVEWNHVLGGIRRHGQLLGEIELREDGGDLKELRDASADQLAERRAAIEREITRLKEDADRREQALKEKFRAIAEKFEQEREPYPEGYDAGSDP